MNQKGWCRKAIFSRMGELAQLPHQALALPVVGTGPGDRINAGGAIVAWERRLAGWLGGFQYIADFDQAAPASLTVPTFADKFPADCLPVVALSAGSEPFGQGGGGESRLPSAFSAFHKYEAAEADQFSERIRQGASHDLNRNEKGTSSTGRGSYFKERRQVIRVSRIITQAVIKINRQLGWPFMCNHYQNIPGAFAVNSDCGLTPG